MRAILLLVTGLGLAGIRAVDAEDAADAKGNGEAERPSFLWLTIEDSSPYQFSCYGNKDISTPAIDRLAAGGVRFSRACSVAPHCSPARSTLITGAFATTYGMDFHRKAFETPDDIFFPACLRQAGYYCTNNNKTHYNSTRVKIEELWDERDLSASYASPGRKPGQPFFAVFNFGGTHMSRFRSITLEGRRDLKPLGIDTSSIFLPPHVPDLPTMRSDQALMLERSLECDAWVSAFVEDLKAKGLDQDTIVFFFSDHGGCVPRGKGYPFESGLRVPLVMYVPPKWCERLKVRPGTTDTRLIGFEDLAPTVLSMAGVKPPKHMQGKAFFGGYENAREKGGLQFGFRTNQESNHYDPCRTATDGRYKYIRNYMPFKPFSLRNFFQWGMPANLAWDEYILFGACNNPLWSQTYKPKPSEMLFDLENDPWELNNLADRPESQAVLARFRKAVSDHIRSTQDLGFIVIGLRVKQNGLYRWVRESGFPLNELHDAAELASMPAAEDAKRLAAILGSPHPELRYWGAVGFCTLGSRGLVTKCPDEVLQLVKDPIPEVATAAADAVCYLGRSDAGLPRLFELLAADLNLAYSSLEAQTWHAGTKQRMMEYVLRLKELGDGKSGPAGVPIKARSLLINLGQLPVMKLYTEEEIAMAKRVNLAAPEFDYRSYLKEMETRKPENVTRKRASEDGRE